jgi:hypothetical protein
VSARRDPERDAPPPRPEALDTVRVDVPCTCAAGTATLCAARPNELPSGAFCPGCARPIALHDDHLTAEGGLTGCLACGHPELYRTKAFPRSLGIAIVVVAAVLAPFTYYMSLVVAAAIDCAAYLAVKDVLVCYACGARHHGFPRKPKHPRFDREIAERLRYGERAVMGKPMRPGGTAGAPEPEH